MNSTIPSNLSLNELLYLELETIDNALCKGLFKRSKNSNANVELLPITLFPSIFPKDKFQLAIDIQTEINLISHRIANDYCFLQKTLEPVLCVDNFTKILFDIYETVLKNGIAQESSLGIFRSDYMLDHKTQKLQQIEMNTISVSFGGLTPILRKIHYSNLETWNKSLSTDYSFKNSSEEIAKGIFLALLNYDNNLKSGVLFIVEDNPSNFSDQKQIEFSLKKLKPDIKIIRKSFRSLSLNGFRLNENRLLFVDNLEIGVCYFRDGYTPEVFSEETIKIREKIELSKAIKCPSIHYHLAGVKKIQQVLTDKEVLRKFCSNEDILNKVYSVFANIYELNDETASMVLKDPTRFVLKPQREGGGNNYYGNDIVNIIEPIKNSKERDAFILMDLIEPQKIENYVISSNKKISSLTKDKLIGELGIFGVILADQKTVFHNYEAGCLLRSKNPEVNEGGIVAGQGVLDTVFLY